MVANKTVAETDFSDVARQKNRIRMSRLGVINAFTQSTVMALFAVAGSIPAWVAAAFFVASTGSSVAFYSFIRFGLNRKLRDKGMLVPQLLASLCIQILFLILAPHLAVLFLLALFVTMGYGAIQFSPRQFTIAWGAYGVITALALWLVRDRFGYPGVSAFQVSLVWLWFFLALRLQTNTSVQFSQLRDELFKKNQALKHSLIKIEELANHDYLTGALNRRNITELLESELQRSSRTDESFCYAMIDIDHFKNVNDTFGHAAGDVVLKELAECAKISLRASDRFGRLGGEEFGIVLPATQLDQGISVIERLRLKIAEHEWNEIQPGLKISFSSGITSNHHQDNLESITKRVDKALYEAKNSGRNKVVAVAEAAPTQ